MSATVVGTTITRSELHHFYLSENLTLPIVDFPRFGGHLT